jgi:hypothetical protein
MYEVTITNLSKGQTFTPQLVVTHSADVRLFNPGEPAIAELALLAEGGDTGPLTGVLQSAGNAVGEVKTIPGLLLPGQTSTVRIEAGRGQAFISAAAVPALLMQFACMYDPAHILSHHILPIPLVVAGMTLVHQLGLWLRRPRS